MVKQLSKTEMTQINGGAQAVQDGASNPYYAVGGWGYGASGFSSVGSQMAKFWADAWKSAFGH